MQNRVRVDDVDGRHGSRGQSAKGLASTVSKYTSVELALHP